MLFNLERFSKLILGEITDIKTYNNNLFFLSLSLIPVIFLFISVLFSVFCYAMSTDIGKVYIILRYANNTTYSILFFSLILYTNTQYDEMVPASVFTRNENLPNIQASQNVNINQCALMNIIIAVMS